MDTKLKFPCDFNACRSCNPRICFVLLLTLLAGCGRTATTLSRDDIASDAKDEVERLVVVPGIDDRTLVAPLADAYNRLDPANDGWQTEVLGSAVQSQLQSIGDWLTTGRLSVGTTWATLADAKLSLATLIPSDLPIVFQEGPLIVRRASDAVAAGVDGDLQTQLNEIARLFSNERAGHTKFKVVRVETASANSDLTSTLIYFHADGDRAEGGRIEVTAEWLCRWRMKANDVPILVGLDVNDCEIVELVGEPKPLFADCTSTVMGRVPAYRDQLLYSTDYWRGRICRELGLDVVANHGLAIGDVNGDMLEDIYLCQQGGLPNRLFLRNDDGTLRDATKESGADWMEYSASALLVDFDNNGTRDLIVALETSVILMSNLGDGRFDLVGEMPATAQVFSMSASDFDQDGDLDIFVCGYNPLQDKARTGAMGEPIPYHDAQNGGANMLLRNDGDWLISNVVEEVGLGENNNRFSFAASWEDYDNDGDFDLYVANDYGRNNLYRNDGGRFRDVAAELGVEDMSAGMAVSWADYNRDGWMDFYVSNMFSAAGNRITYQRQFKSGSADETTKQGYQRHARGNSLFSNTGNGFRDVSVASRVTMGRWAWGNRFLDMNNDGWEDLVVNNGFISTEDTGDL